MLAVLRRPCNAVGVVINVHCASNPQLELTMSISDARQTIQSLRKLATRRDEVIDETLLDVQVALVFAQVADFVALGQRRATSLPQSCW